jgi:signal transduction histidine kinase
MRLERLLSLGHSRTLPDRLGRHVRVTNSLALFGAVLSATGIPMDLIGAPWPVVLIDFVSAMLFASCWYLNARGHLTAARVLLMSASNIVILGGILHIGGAAEIRTMCFPLVVMPFLVFSVTERIPLAVFVVIPTLAYFTLGEIHVENPGLSHQIDLVYSPILAFAMIIAATYVFGSIDRRADRDLLHARARAANSARLAALGEMSGGIAHEVRNPLAAIHLAATQIVERPQETTQVVQLAERISRIVKRASKIIETLRAFAREGTSDPFTRVTVRRILGDTLELCGKRVAEHGVELTVASIAEELVVECRALQLSQVLMNLIANAYDAVDDLPERWVRIDARAIDEHVEIAVTDSGEGINAAIQPRIFEPFFTTKPLDRGTGLGLSLSRGLVEAHRGTLTLDTSSRNTRFVMRLPAADPPSHSSQPPVDVGMVA